MVFEVCAFCSKKKGDADLHCFWALTPESMRGSRLARDESDKGREGAQLR